MQDNCILKIESDTELVNTIGLCCLYYNILEQSNDDEDYTP